MLKKEKRQIKLVPGIINLLRWNDVPRTSISPKIAIFSQFSVYLNVTQVKW